MNPEEQPRYNPLGHAIEQFTGTLANKLEEGEAAKKELAALKEAQTMKTLALSVEDLTTLLRTVLPELAEPDPERAAAAVYVKVRMILYDAADVSHHIVIEDCEYLKEPLTIQIKPRAEWMRQGI